MGNEQGAKAQGQLVEGDPVLGAEEVNDEPIVGGQVVPAAEGGHKEQAHGHTGDDVGVHHGNVVDGEQRLPELPAHGVQANGAEGAHHRGNEGGQHRHQQGVVHTLDNQLILEQLGIPPQGEALPHHAGVCGVEGVENEQQNGGIEEEEHHTDEDAVAQAVFLVQTHSITACSSPSPKRFIIHMQATTMTIITRAMAEPRCGL